jgi:hypothetical protein
MAKLPTFEELGRQNVPLESAHAAEPDFRATRYSRPTIVADKDARVRAAK